MNTPLTKSLKKTNPPANTMGLREYIAIHAPAAEVDGIVGESSADGAKFLGIEVTDYEPRKHFLECCVKARVMYADALLAELQKPASAAPSGAECPVCAGTGDNGSTGPHPCAHCGGTGNVAPPSPTSMTAQRDGLRKALSGLLSCVDEWEEAGFIVLRGKGQPDDSEPSLISDARKAMEETK